MLIPKDVSDFETLKAQAVSFIPENTILPVVEGRLYLNKDGSWHARFMMSGYSLGEPTLRDLLKQYVFAVSGVEPTDEQVENTEPLILERLTYSLDQAISKLWKFPQMR